MDNKEAYATYKPLKKISYKIIQYLMQDSNAEIIWKLLKYNDADAWEKDNLTQEEKAALIYSGKGSQDTYSVFLDFMMDDATTAQKSFLRIYPSVIIPTNRTVGICCISLEVFVHSQINHLSDYTTRLDTIIQSLLEVLNGKNVGGLGVLFFDYGATSNCRIQTIGEKPYKGKIITMGVNMN